MLLMRSTKPAIYLALLHYPVWNKNREVVATAVTNVDLHDIARSSRTYGVRGVFFVTPIEQQVLLVQDILQHWTGGAGSRRNSIRAEAFHRAKVVEALDDAISEVTRLEGVTPALVATSARFEGDVTTYDAFRAQLRSNEAMPPQLLLFGTGWGMADEVVTRATTRLAPIHASDWALGDDGPYNHLSVRSAVAIVLDRLCGDRGADGK
jgi:hypothetical protein